MPDAPQTPPPIRGPKNTKNSPGPSPRPTSAGGRRTARGWLSLVLVGVLVLAAILAVVALTRGSGSSTTTTTTAGLDELRLMHGVAPWPANNQTALKRLPVLGLPVLKAEALAYHIHAHLDVYVDGRPVPVPAGIGIGPQGSWITVLHTHDQSGVIHIEAPAKATYTLGQFLGVWGIYLTDKCLGAYCQGLHLYVDGHAVSLPPAKLALARHQEIVLAVGKPPTQIPSRYTFPLGD